MFEPTGTTKGAASFGQIMDGKYSISIAERGPLVGTHKVKFTWHRSTGQKDAGGGDITEQVIPEKFHGKETELTATIKAGDNKHDFDLKSK